MQNEIIGDLTVEFSALPDGAEELTLDALGTNLEPQFNGQLGEVSSALVAKFISALMPAKFGLNSARDYAHDKWLLGPSRQTSLILLAAATASVTVSSRFANVDSAKAFLDDSVRAYAATIGLVLQSQDAAMEVSPSAAAMIDSTALKSLSEENRQLARRQLNVLADHLKLDVTEIGHVSELDSVTQELQDRLDKLRAEVGAEFADGVNPRFDARKSRHFDFAWNQAREDLMRTYHAPASQDFVLGHNAVQLGAFALRRGDSALTLTHSLPISSSSSETLAPFNRGASDIAADTAKARLSLPASRPRTIVNKDGSIVSDEVSSSSLLEGTNYSTVISQGLSSCSKHLSSKVQILSKVESSWNAQLDATNHFFKIINDLQSIGVSYQGMNVLVTGAGKQSIAEEVVRILLMGGAHVIVASSRGPADSAQHYRQLYAQSCGQRSSLTVLPFNQASSLDCKDLIDHIYSQDGLDRDLDAIIPFAALSEKGIEVDGIDGKSELAHRLMLTNVLRLVGHIIRNKRSHKIDCRLTQVILPFSPNHGVFGGDGLYSASKLGLESMMERVVSESWSDAVSICGVVIGWTRGTGLMQQNDIVAEKIEANGVLTFAQKEMAANVAAMIAPEMASLCEDQPLLADFSGGLGQLSELKTVLDSSREETVLAASITKAIHEEDRLEKGEEFAEGQVSTLHAKPLTTLQLDFPKLPDFDRDLKQLGHLQDMVDLSGVVVVVGYSELGPWGNARTRWAMESQNALSQAACIELAWMTNMIKHFDGSDSKGLYVGWVDVQSGERVQDYQIPERYGMRLMENCGIRLIKPQDHDGYDPENKESLQEIAIDEDLPEFETDADSAAGFAKRHGDSVVVKSVDGSDQKRVRFKAGARVMVPRATKVESSLVAGQLPSGWNPRVYGINEEVVNQVDPVTLYVLCCVAEASLSAGITNLMEMYQYIHTSEIGNIIGSSMGGTQKTRNMYRDIYLNKYVQGDVIQETYLNTPSAWVNMLLLGSNGPIKTPVGACATGVEAVDIGYDSIVSGKTKMCIVGGTDNFHEDESYGFSTLKATVNTAKELASGRLPHEMSRPMAETRAGFVESQGCGIQILCNAELAIKMGLPIYAIAAGSAMAADKISKSVPAPGQGVLTFARESEAASNSLLLDVHWRKACLRAELAKLSKPAAQPPTPFLPVASGILTPPMSWSESGDTLNLKQELPVLTESSIPQAQMKAIQRLWGNDFRVQDTSISPMRAALAVWGLTIDDVSVVSLHGTSTKANDKNESQVVNTQMRHLKRGNIPLLAICQKSVTGHPKAPAASWMLNGCLQALSTGLVPGNRNADNVDPVLKQFEHLVYPTAPVQTRGIDAFLLNSFGFGQKGGQMIGVHPRFVLATLKQHEYEAYAAKNADRVQLANREFAKSMFSNCIVKIVDKPQYAAGDEAHVFLNPHARISDSMVFQPETRKVPSNPRFDVLRLTPDGTGDSMKPKNPLQNALMKVQTIVDESLQSSPRALSTANSTGIDAEDLQAFTSDQNPVFIERNYTEEEQQYALSSVDSHATFVGRWCAKEAIFKSLGIPSLGAGAPLKDIEIVAMGKDKPEVKVSCSTYFWTKR